MYSKMKVEGSQGRSAPVMRARRVHDYLLESENITFASKIILSHRFYFAVARYNVRYIVTSCKKQILL